MLVAVSQAEASGSVRALAIATAVGGPILLVAFALVCWLLVGRALRAGLAAAHRGRGDRRGRIR